LFPCIVSAPNRVEKDAEIPESHVEFDPLIHWYGSIDNSQISLGCGDARFRANRGHSFAAHSRCKKYLLILADFLIQGIYSRGERRRQRHSQDATFLDLPILSTN